MRLKVLGILLCCVVLLSEVALATTATDCVHQWSEEDATMLDEFVRFELTAQDDEYHVIWWREPDAVCTICGEIVYGGNGSKVVHSYVVKEWTRIEDDMIQIEYGCCVCQHTYLVEIGLQMVYDGAADSCLYGGICDTKLCGYMNESNCIIPDLGISIPGIYELEEKTYYSALIYDNADGTFLFAGRVYCPICGRPRLSTSEIPTTNFSNWYNGLPIMTEEYFLTVDMPDNLPYQLIDQLRKEAGDA